MQIFLVTKTRKLLNKNIAFSESFYLKVLFVFLLKKKVTVSL